MIAQTRKIKLLALAMFGSLALLIVGVNANQASDPAQQDSPIRITEVSVPEGRAVATFAAGCFWCTEAAFQELEGVESAVSGYAGGQLENPTYEDVYTQRSDHREALQIIYNPTLISYEQLLQVLWRNIDPLDGGGQFVDRGFSYTAAIFYHTEEQRIQAEDSRQEEFEAGKQAGRNPEGRDIVTPILPFTTFYEAESYHQDFYLNSAERYANYESASGREQYKQQVWGEIQKAQ